MLMRPSKRMMQFSRFTSLKLPSRSACLSVIVWFLRSTRPFTDLVNSSCFSASCEFEVFCFSWVSLFRLNLNLVRGIFWFSFWIEFSSELIFCLSDHWSFLVMVKLICVKYSRSPLNESQSEFTISLRMVGTSSSRLMTASISTSD